MITSREIRTFKFIVEREDFKINQVEVKTITENDNNDST